MSTYSEFFLKSSGSVAEVECVEIYHPNFTPASHTYRIVIDKIIKPFFVGLKPGYDCVSCKSHAFPLFRN